MSLETIGCKEKEVVDPLFEDHVQHPGVSPDIFYDQDVQWSKSGIRGGLKLYRSSPIEK